MRSEEAQIGKRVRVRKDHRTANLRGQEGVIVKTWGNPGYTALDVLLDKEFGPGSVALGRDVFARECAICHSSQPPPYDNTDFRALNPKDPSQ